VALHRPPRRAAAALALVRLQAAQERATCGCPPVKQQPPGGGSARGFGSGSRRGARAPPPHLRVLRLKCGPDCSTRALYAFCGGDHVCAFNRPPAGGVIKRVTLFRYNGDGKYETGAVSKRFASPGTVMGLLHGVDTRRRSGACVLRLRPNPHAKGTAAQYERFIDGSASASAARHINHSCDPADVNVEFQQWTQDATDANGRATTLTYVVAVASRYIKSGAKLFVSYGWDEEGWAAVGGCKCGRPTCNFSRDRLAARLVDLPARSLGGGRRGQ